MSARKKRTLVEDRECHVDWLANGEACHRVHLFVQQEHRAALFLVLRQGRRCEGEQTRPEQHHAAQAASAEKLHELADADSREMASLASRGVTR